MTHAIKYIGLLALAVMVLATGCGPKPEAANSKRIVVTDDIVYRSGTSDAWKLDVAVPENFGGELRPALVIVHGGGWRAGSKQDLPYRSQLLDYALRGYVTFSVDYRLTDEAPLPAAINDVKCAVRWVRAHADDYRIDPERIGIYGHSAGAHLSLMVGMSPTEADAGDDCDWKDYPSRVAAAAGGSTPTDISARVEGGDVMSPVHYVGRDVLPLLLIHGTSDEVVPIGPVDAFVESLKAAGAPDVTYIRVDDANHGVAFEHYMMRSKTALYEFFGRTLGGEVDS